MIARRLFLTALTTTALAVAAPGAAQASSWTNQETLSASGAPISQLAGPSLNNRIAAAPDGSVAVGWIQSDGSDDRLVVRRYSASSRSWSPAQYVSPANQNLFTAEVVMDSDGNATALWVGGSFDTVGTSTLRSGESEWSTPFALVAGGVNGFGATAGPDGTITVAAVVPTSGNPELRVYSRARNSASWGTPTTIASDGASLNAAISIDYNAKGDGVMLFTGYASGSNNAYISRYDRKTGTWSAAPSPVFVNVTSGFTADQDVALAASGDVAAVVNPNDFLPRIRIITSFDTLAATQVLGSGVNVIPQVAADDMNRFVATWQQIDLGTGDVTGFSSFSDPGPGTWSTPAVVPGADSAIDLIGNDNGQIGLLTGVGSDISQINSYGIASTTWSSWDQAWKPLEQVQGSNATTFNAFANTGQGHSPIAALSATGDLVAAWSQNLPGGSFGIGFAANDQSGPAFSAVSVPAEGVAGTPMTFSVSATDPWSDVASVAWEFAEGGTATGSSVSYTYRSQGIYHVTVTATDSRGNSSSTTRRVVVAPAPPAPPAADPKPPVLAPVIEARLAGRTITLNARVTLRKGKSCTGRATATTNFGTTTYRTSLKLAKVGDDCVGTGTIRLKKAPSARTRLRVTVSSKKTKTRTIATKRG